MADPKQLISSFAHMLQPHIEKGMQDRNIKISPSVKDVEKHWEDTWNRAEEATTKLPSPTLEEHVNQINKYMKLIGEGNHLLLGEVIFEICGMTKKLNINIDVLLNRICDHYEKELAFHSPEEVHHYGGEKRLEKE